MVEIADEKLFVLLLALCVASVVLPVFVLFRGVFYRRRRERWNRELAGTVAGSARSVSDLTPFLDTICLFSFFNIKHKTVFFF